ncbi:hypothetical protein ACWELJ_04990 [Nocardia sp. NPDC004582]
MKQAEQSVLSAHLSHSMGEFALAYADQTDADHESLLAAIESGRITARG